MTEEQSVTAKKFKLFPNEKISLQHSVLSYQIDLYFHEHKLAIEVQERQSCEFIRINPDVKDYDKYGRISKIHNHITESTKKITEESTKKSLIDIFQIRLELKFKPNHSIKFSTLKYAV